MRPDDRAGVEAGRQLPFDLRRQSGVAGYLPVRVPFVFVLEAQADRQRLAWNDRIGRSDQFGINVFFGRRRSAAAIEPQRTLQRQW